jgi:RHS repeat-associated protein
MLLSGLIQRTLPSRSASLLARAFLLAGAILLAASAYGQTCPDPWGSADFMYGTVMLDAGGNGNNGPYTTSTDQSAAVQVKMAAQIACSWATLQVPGIGAGSDQIVLNDQLTDTTCAGPQIDTWAGTGPGVNLQVNLGIESFANVYSFGAYDEVNGTFTQKGCITGSQSLALGWGPDSQVNNEMIPLPDTVQLSGVKLFSDLPTDTTQTNIQANFGLAWSFSPDPDDMCEDCTKQMLHDFASDLSIGTQSLGEDIAVVGTPFLLHYESARAPGRAGVDAFAMFDAHSLGGWTLNIHHVLEPLLETYCFGGSCTPYSTVPKAVFLGDGQTRTDDAIQSPIPLNGNLAVASEDGSEIYVFNTHGFHLKTLLPLTGAVMYTFGYDLHSRLVTITDNSGNVTTIQRDASENPIAIVAPYGQKTTLAVDSNGYLNKITDPAGLVTKFTNSVSGLLTSVTDPLGKTFTLQYDAFGRLAQHTDPAGASVTLARAENASGYTVTETSAMGRTTSRQIGFSSTSTQNNRNFTNTWENGLQASSSKALQSGKIMEASTLPDGTSYATTEAPDPRWGMQSPVQTSHTATNGTLSTNFTASRKVTLSNPSNLFSLATETDTEAINGRAYTTTFDGSTRTFVHSSPMGRTVTAILDPLERIVSTQVAGLTATTYAYDSHGRIASSTQGSRKTTFTYNSKGFLASITDPLKLKTSFGYDLDGRRTTTTLPDGRVIPFKYDADGNLTSVTPPGGSAHLFKYAGLDLPSTYTPPTVSGTGPTTYAYDLDHARTSLVRPGGGTTSYAYDSAGRITSIATPTGTTSFTYNATTGNLSSVGRGSEHIAYSYNGPLLTKATLTGTVAGSVGQVFNNNLFVTSQTINGANTVAMTYDKDGLITKAGSLTITHNTQNGLITGTTLGVTTDSRTYNGAGELTSYTASVSGVKVYGVTFTRDLDGRITARKEAIGSTTNNYSYSYDPAGRLITAVKNTSTDDYAYDDNSNRVSATTPTTTATGTYDAQDRLLTYGAATYTYTANGELATQTLSAKKTTYKYDVLGNLTAATLPSGTKIAYTVDPENHRVGKSVNGTLQTGYLYDDADQIVAQLNGTNQLISQFVYGTNADTPDYMINGGVSYRIFSDHLGSPVLIVNAATGAIVEQIAYDEYGNVLSDTHPGLQPFGFAGGLYDLDTGLIQFGARDYNPATGRWTAKDPTVFAGGDTNQYAYVVNDPINSTDPTGLSGCDKKKVKKIINKLEHKITGDKIKIGPVNVSITKPEMSVGTSVGVKVQGHTVVEATGTATVAVTPTAAPADPHQWYQDPAPIIETTGEVKVKFLDKISVEIGKWKAKHWDTSKWGVVPGARGRYDGYEENCDGICRDR